MYIRAAEQKDFERITQIYEYARKFQAENGNPSQWINGYPWHWLIKKDIEEKRCYVCMTSEGETAGVFTLFDGADPTYAVIDGAWVSDEPYLTIHRIASAGIRHGIVKFCVDWAYSRLPNVRIDTHRDNSVMRHILPKLGFVQCGVIITHNGTERIAFQKC